MNFSRLTLLCLFLLHWSTTNAQITLNELLASNATVNQDPDFQGYSDWVELYNSSAVEIDLSAWLLSDDADLPGKWIFPTGTTIPANGYLLIWTDGQNTGLHTNFKLSAGSEKVILSSPFGTEIDRISFGTQLTNVSYGRKENGTGTWGFFSVPTPNASNTGSVFFNDYVKPVPVFALPGGFYPDPVTVNIQNLTGKGVLRYTTDGSVPTADSPVFSQPFELLLNTVVKARIFVDGQIPGPVVTNTYFVSEDLQARGLAVLSLSGDPANFFGPDSGILVQNFKPLWEIPIHLEFYENDGLLGFHHDAGASVGGENAWVLPQKLLNIASRKQYGGSHIEYQVFPDSKRTRFEDLILRTSGNDWANTLFRDGMMQGTAASTADLDVQSFRPVATFINGQYYGIHNLREKQDKEYTEIHHSIDPDSLDYIENEAEIKEGDAIAYQEMVSLLEAGVQTDAAFQNLAKICDTQNFTDYIISQIFVANTSWGHNIALFRKRSPEAKWRWLLHDYDRGFNLAEVGGTGMNWATATNGASYSNPAFATLFLRKMLENNTYKQAFINRFADHLFVTWNPQWVGPRVNKHANWIKNEIPYHVGKWAGTTSSYGNGIPSVAFWNAEVAKLKTFATQRTAFLFDDLAQFFGLPAASGMTVEVSDAAHGRVRINNMPLLPQYPWAGKYLQQRPFTLTAQARPGFDFVRWEKTVDTTFTFIAAGAVWKYRDAVDAPPSGWNKVNFDDATWAAGPAQLGYGDGDEATTLSFGGITSNKIIGYYFRKKFTVNNPDNLNPLHVRMICDDGAVVYLNGEEVWRYNMPDPPQTIQHNTLASTFVSGTNESAWLEDKIPTDLLVPGENTIAVEIHQSDVGSSDISFDFEMTSAASGTAQVIGTDAALQTSIANGNPVKYRAVFEANGDCGILPDTIRQNLTLTQACSPYAAVGDVVVLPYVTLTVQAGVEIRLPDQANLWVLGDLQVNGTVNNIVKMKSLPNGGAWGGILLKNTTKKSKMKYLRLENAGAGLHRMYFPAAISAYHADLEMDYLTLTNVTDNPIFARFSDIILTNSTIRSVTTGDGINVKQGKGRVENCTFYADGSLGSDMDAIDFDGVTDGIVRYNVIHDFRGDNCDGLDIGEQCQNLQIEGNFIYHCLDKGISVGQQSTATVRNNTIAYTTIGIALKDQSPVTVDHCTIFGNQQGIAAYEKNPGSLGGIGTITNCIVSNVSVAAYIADSLSSLSLSNCLSGNDTLTGLSNQTADPRFLNPTAYDFHLKPGSTALGAGSGGSNLGANPLPAYPGLPQLMLSEILYNDTLTSTGEFVEIHNPSNQTLALGGYLLSGAIEFLFPQGSSIAPGAYVVIAKHLDQFPANTPYQVFEWTTGKLANEGEKILFFDASGLLVDFVRYNNHAPWPENNTLLGRSLELVSNDLDNHFASSWQPSPAANGSPGTESGIVATQILPLLMDILTYPNPAQTSVHIAIKGFPNGNHVLTISDVQGRNVFSKKIEDQNGFAQYEISVNNWPVGIYWLEILDKNGKTVGTEKIVVKR